MNILISGGKGLIGHAVAEKLKKNNHHVRILTRKASTGPEEFLWAPENGEVDPRAFEDLDCIIHLAGADISKRWTEEYKKELTQSRIRTAALLLEKCLKNNIRLQSFISASGINYYGTFTSDKILIETAGIVKADFLSTLCSQWEAAAGEFSTIADRVVCLRTAVVLAKDGGALPKLRKSMTPVGTGKQWMNWIHIEDLANIYVESVENPNINGEYNAVADELPTNKEFMAALAKVSNKMQIPLHVPAFVLKAIFGEMSSVLLEGTRASNQKIKQTGFQFTFPTLEKALKDLV